MITRRRGVGTRVETVDAPSRFVHETGSVDNILDFNKDLEFRLLTDGKTTTRSVGREARSQAGRTLRSD